MKKKLIGKWLIVCWKVNTKKGWENLKGYPNNKYSWEFRPNGKLLETFSPENSATTNYYTSQTESLLIIDRSHYASDGYLLACIEERYRVEFLSDRYMILYDLDEVKVEPDDYSFMMELERL